MTSKLEQIMKNGGQFSRLMLQSLTDYAVFIIDETRRIASWNPAAQKLFGYEEHEVIGQKANIIFTPADVEAGEAARELDEALETGRADDERWHVRRDGSKFWAQGVVNLLRDDSGEVIGYVKIVRDLTERKIAEEKIQELNETLEQRVEERTRQVREMATKLSRVEHRERQKIADDLHDDLAQLLVSVRMKLSLVKPADDASQEMVGEIEKTVDDALRFVRTLIAELRPTVLHEQGLESAIEWLADRMQERFHLKVMLDSDDSTTPISEDVRLTLFQAVRELLVNVAKHAEADHAAVSVKREGDRVRMVVADEGVGFRMAENQDPNTSPEAGGYGLLSVRERIRLVGGKINVQSTPDKGSQITITVPLEPDPPIPDKKSTAA